MNVRLAAALCATVLSFGFALSSDLDPVHERIRDAVIRDVLGGQADEIRVVATRDPIRPDQRWEFAWSGGTVELPDGTVWFALADAQPGVLGFHPVRHVFLDGDLRILEVRDATFYPRIYVDGTRVGPVTLVEYRRRAGQPPADRVSPPAPGTFGPAGFTYNNFYAVIIEGDVPSGDSYSEFWTDNVSMFRILLEYGYLEQNIHVLYGEGHDESTWHCTYYRENMVDFAAYHQDVRNVFTWMRDGNATHNIARVTDQDFIYLFTFDHGSGSNCNSSLCLMDGCMADTEFASYFNQIPYKHRAVNMQQCNSGGFIDNLTNVRTVISTAANCNESAYESDQQDTCDGHPVKYGEWNYWWMAAMRGTKPWPGLQPVDADTDNDGVVSFLEAHNYALANDDAWEHPMWDDPGSIGNQLTLVTTPAGPHLVYDSHRLIEQVGNADGVANPGETFVMPVTLFDNGAEPATAISGTLRSSSPWVVIEDATAAWPNMATGTGAESLPDHFRWRSDPATPDDTSVSFYVDWTITGATGTTSFTERVATVALTVQQSVVDDAALGDGDGVADPGESFNVSVVLRNKGHAAARAVSGVLSTNSPWATITGSQAAWPDIPALGAARSLAPHFGVRLAPDVPLRTWIECRLDVTAADGVSFELPVRFIVGSRGSVLLVEDGDVAEADLLQELIGNLGYGVVRDTASLTDPDAWSTYDMLVWAGGSSSSPVGTADQRTALEQFVAGGGRLLVSGGDLGYARRNDTSFRNNVLHISGWYSDGSGDMRVAVGTHPLATLPALLEPTLPVSTTSTRQRDAVTPAAGARPILDWPGAGGRAALVAFDDDELEGNGGQVISLFVALQNVADTAGQRRQLVENCLEWLGGSDKPYLLLWGEVLDDSEGNADGVPDPGETLHIPIDLVNEGSGAATGTWGRAETDHPAEAQFIDNYANWELIGSGVTARSLAPHLLLRLAPGTPCGTVIAVTLELRTAEGFTATRSFTFKVGTGGGQHRVFASTDTPIAIPNPGTLDDVVAVPDAFRIGDVNCAVNLDHSATTAIKITLEGPDGTRVTLHDHDNVGSHLDTIYDSQTQPHGPGRMSDYDGKVGTGAWHLYVDDTKGDMLIGRLNAWSLIFDTSDLCHDWSCSAGPAPEVGPTLRLARLAGTDLRLEWQTVAGASAYNVWRSRAPDFSAPETAGRSTLGSYDECGLPCDGPIYYYLVRAENACHQEGP
ncbi:MAG: proprotein convertase P-domain-containing protein [Acidobacteria bacterium]|nr:proprotein convertase P-domain-containing protein [Acidobacteriota bacterium]